MLTGFGSEIKPIEKIDFGGEINPGIKPETDITMGEGKEIYKALFRLDRIEDVESRPLRPLTHEQELNVQEKTNMSNQTLKDCMYNVETGNVRLKCINEHLAGKRHEVTGVEYKEKVVDINGINVEGVLTEFESIFDGQLSEENILARDYIQEREFIGQLKEALVSSPELKSKFSDIQIQMIENGHIPRGFTCHHAPERGNMQLVRTDIHSKTPHTGGRAIWGGGQDYR